MSAHILYFDIGNTNTKIGVDNGSSTLASYTVPTNGEQTPDRFGFTLLDILRHNGIAPGDVTAALASSVVPHVADVIRNACARFLNLTPLFTPDDIPIPLENKYARPHEVGADRLVGAYAARRLFPDAASLISVDFGTATTFDCVQGNAYLGGLICPGVLSSASSLAIGTAKLPRVSLEVHDTILTLGRSTSTSLNQGFVFGFAAMTEGLIRRLTATLRCPVTIIGTGGFARALSKVTDCFDAVYPDLLLEGLRILYQKQTAAKTGNHPLLSSTTDQKEAP